MIMIMICSNANLDRNNRGETHVCFAHACQCTRNISSTSIQPGSPTTIFYRVVYEFHHVSSKDLLCHHFKNGGVAASRVQIQTTCCNGNFSTLHLSQGLIIVSRYQLK